jgi:hypothetical protein
MKNKEFDAVKMMRDIRDNLNKKYEKNPALREKNLQQIRKKYGLKTTKKIKVA